MAVYVDHTPGVPGRQPSLWNSSGVLFVSPITCQR